MKLKMVRNQTLEKILLAKEKEMNTMHKSKELCKVSLLVAQLKWKENMLLFILAETQQT